MKKVIIAQTILDAVEQSTTLFGRGSIKLYPVRSSEEILDIHRRIKADIIITEFSLPVMGGVRLCSAIRSEQGLKDVSLILSMTAAFPGRLPGCRRKCRHPSRSTRTTCSRKYPADRHSAAEGYADARAYFRGRPV
jgi:CheY-like chemotaxis protein